MDSEVLKYVIPAVVGAIVAGVVGVIPYFRSRKTTVLEDAQAELSVSEAVRNSIESAKLMYDGLGERIIVLEKENKDLKLQVGVLNKNNAYISDLEATKYELEAQVDMLNSRMELMETQIKIVLAAFRVFLDAPHSPNSDETTRLRVMLNDVEGKL